MALCGSIFRPLASSGVHRPSSSWRRTPLPASPRILVRSAIPERGVVGRRGVVVWARENNSKQGSEVESSSDADVEAMEARVGVGRRARKQQQREAGSDGPTPKPGAAKPPPKTWDSMDLAEKAWSLYIDPDKGVLYWLNKLAYASIYVIIGGWIAFRFIGPALGLYQLDQPLLSPDRLLDGGP